MRNHQSLLKLFLIINVTAWLAACGGGGSSSDSEPGLYAIGDKGPAGGIVFYITEGGLHGLEAAPVDQSITFTPWGCRGTLIAGADETAIGTGAQNTADILAGCPDTPIAADIAAGYTLNGFNDWFLPSKDELRELYGNRWVVGGLSDAEKGYWSSSETNVDEAQGLIFHTGRHNSASKHIPARVRAVRAF